MADGEANENFGKSVAIGSNTVIVGAGRDDIGADVNQGSAYVFFRSGTTWTQQQRLTASDRSAGDEFGTSVEIAVAVNTVIVGSPNDDFNGVNDKGSAYVFTPFRMRLFHDQRVRQAFSLSTRSFAGRVLEQNDIADRAPAC